MTGEGAGDEHTARSRIQPPAVFSTSLTGTFNRQVVDRGRFVFNTALDPSSFTRDQVSLLDNSGNLINVTGVTPVDGTNTRFDVTFDPQSDLGTDTLPAFPAITDAPAHPIARP